MTDTIRTAHDVDDPSSANPYLIGNMAPVEREVTAFDLPVTGSIPVELDGRWLRNGPNPRGPVDPATHHWFLGDGMVHGVRIRGGQAEWYRNRYVAGADGFGPNTNVGGFAGRTWATVEAGTPPVELDHELNSLGVNRFQDTLTGPFSAHPKYDPATGELHAMGYHWPDLVDHIQYIVVGPDGRVSSTLDIPVPDMPMVHDMSLTPSYAVVYDLPVTVSFDVMGKGFPFPFAWNPDRAARVGLLPRSGTADDIIWCDVDPCYVFHPLNAYDAPDGTVVVDLCRYDSMMVADFRGPFGESLPTFDRWVIDPVARRVTETRIDDRPQEFPRHNPRVGTPAAPLRVHVRGEAGDGQPARGDHQDRRRRGHHRSARVRERSRRRRAGRRPQGRCRRRGRLLGPHRRVRRDHRLQRAVHPRRRRHHRTRGRPHLTPPTRPLRLPRQLGRHHLTPPPFS